MRCNEIMVQNGSVACEPLKKTSADVRISKGVAMVAERQALLATVVIYGDGKTYRPGDRVYVKGDATAGWATAVMEIDGRGVILVPAQVIVARERRDVSAPPPDNFGSF